MHTTMNRANAAIALLEDVIAASWKMPSFFIGLGSQHFRIHRKTGLRGLTKGTSKALTHSGRVGSGVRFTSDDLLE
jgi:hypothetical protein